MAAADPHPLPYLLASAVSSFVTLPVWKAATIGQSGYALTAESSLGRFLEAARPPYRGSFVVVSGRTWAQAMIFFGSDEGSRWLRRCGWSSLWASCVPPLLISANVQVANQPFVRSSIMLQGDPQVRFAHSSHSPNLAVLRYLWRTKGLRALWLGTGVSIARTAPKYVAAVGAKDAMEELLAQDDDMTMASCVLRSIKKSVAASIAGSIVTNPLDVAQNEMYKTGDSFVSTVKRLQCAEGCRWFFRGVDKNVLASAMPIALTIFLTDAFTQWSRAVAEQKRNQGCCPAARLQSTLFFITKSRCRTSQAMCCSHWLGGSGRCEVRATAGSPAQKGSVSSRVSSGASRSSLVKRPFRFLLPFFVWISSREDPPGHSGLLIAGMDRTGGLKLHRLPAEELRVHRFDHIESRLHSRGSQVRSESNQVRGHDSRDIVRASTSRSEDRVARDGAKDEVSLSGPLSETHSLEEFVQQDLDAFWRWCATPIDGLHRCGLLVKLFDYSGLTLEKATDKVCKLNSELHALGVCATDQVEPYQRVPYEAFVQSRRLREAVQSCTGSKLSREKRSGRAGGPTPLALWVLNVISLEGKGFLSGRPDRLNDLP
ncbi:Slc25a25 [Symbiodinium sp. CCMP2456]|nr:Slc25a25 [Symbiodinium sp. CCMP2456]